MRLLRNLLACAAFAAACGCSGDDAGGSSGTDAGLADDGGEAGNGSSGQGGGGTGRDSGFDIDGSVVGLSCQTDTDCGDADVYQCVNEVCIARRLPSGVWQSGGGGLTESEQFELRISIGAPAPMGRASSDRFEITIGAGAGRP